MTTEQQNINTQKKPFGEWWREFVFRLKIFGWYLLTEPFRLALELWKSFYHFVGILNKLTSWLYILLMGSIVSIIMNKGILASILLLVLLIAILLWEWDRGYFMNRYRQRVKEKINKKLKEDIQNGRSQYVHK